MEIETTIKINYSHHPPLRKEVKNLEDAKRKVEKNKRDAEDDADAAKKKAEKKIKDLETAKKAEEKGREEANVEIEKLKKKLEVGRDLGRRGGRVLFFFWYGK